MKTTTLKTLATLAALAGIQAALLAEPLTFDFKDPKGVNNATFTLDAPLEAISGSADGVTGTVTFDPANPAATKGRIVIAAASLNVPNSMMKQHMHGPMWMDTGKHTEIVFEAKELKNVKTEGNKTSADAVGSFSLHGVTKELTVPITLTYAPGKLGARVPNLKGDLLVVRTNFVVDRRDFAINPSAPDDKVAYDIHVGVSVAGAAARP